MSSAAAVPGFAESEDALHEEARREVGYDDFGDPSYLDGLRVLLHAYDQEARLNEYGHASARQMIVDTLAKRLRAERAWQQRPEVLEPEISRPLVICGLVRTGSTALHYLLGQDPDLQCLQYWLACNPQPRPPRAEWDDNRDFVRAKAEIDAMYAADPSLRAVHFMMADGPEECRHLMAQHFTDDSFEVNATVPSYSEWYEQADMRPTYRRHRDLVKLTGSTDTERTWLLKYPVHVRSLDAFLDVYPDACVIQTHRDPLSVLPSYVSLISGFRSLVEHDIDRRMIAERQTELWARGVERGIEARKGRDPAQFYDLHFADFMADPIAAVRRIYAHFGRELSEAGEAQLARWSDEHTREKHGKHEYSRDDFGIEPSAVLDRFAGYMEHFGMKPERPASLA